MEALEVGDGVTNVALGTARTMRALGEDGPIRARFVAPALRDSTAAPQGVLEDTAAPLLFHYWNYNTSAWIVHALRGRRALYYHGITPPHFFAAGSELHRMTSAGCDQLRRLVDSFDLLVGLSRYTLSEVVPHLSRPRPIMYLYPIVEPDECRRAPVDGALLERLRASGDVHLVFVGRVVRNKRQDRLMRLFARYQAREPRSRLILVGNEASHPEYRAELERLRVELGCGDRIVFAGKVPEPALNAYLRAAAVFVCASEHEGFCIPIAHAMALDVPVVAYAATAVPETLGGAGTLVDRWDDAQVAELVHGLIVDRGRRAATIARQRTALRRFSAMEAMTRLGAVVDFLRSGTWSPLFSWSHEVRDGVAT
jgi:L-malate glycosyltransferase